jgi:hypothetical protein
MMMAFLFCLVLWRASVIVDEFGGLHMGEEWDTLYHIS